MAISELGYSINTTEVTKAEKALDGLTKAEQKVVKTTNEMGGALSEAGKKAQPTAVTLTNISEITKRLDANNKSLTAAINEAANAIVESNTRAKKSTDETTKSTDKLTKSISGVIKQWAAFGAATFALGRVTSTLASFDQGMASVQAITRATASEMEALRSTAMQMGATTEFSATQAADGLRFLGMAGFTATQSVAALPAVLDLATASGMGLAEAADITSNIMSGFSIAAEDAARVADVLAAGSSQANTNVSQLGTAMAYAAPVAKALGRSVEETAAAIGVLSDNGLQGSQAGTGLRAVLASLVKPSKEGQKALATLGLTLEDVNPQTKSLAEISKTLSEAGLDAGTAMALFGREASSAGLALASGNVRVAQLTDSLNAAEGEADRMAGTMRGSLKGAFNDMSSAAEGVIIAMGDAGLTAVLKAAAISVTSLLRAMSGVATGVGKALEFMGNNVALLGSALFVLGATQAKAAVAGLASLVTWLTTSTIATAAMARAVGMLSLAMNSIPGVAIFTAITLAITGVVQGFIAARSHAEELAKAVGDLGKAQSDLDDLTVAYYKNMTDGNLEAVRQQAQLTLEVNKTALAIAESELANASFYTNLFGYSLYTTQRMADARAEVDRLTASLEETQGVIASTKGMITTTTNEISKTEQATLDAEAATLRWERAMAGVNAQIKAVAASISAIGGGMLDAAAKKVELSALRAGKSVAESAKAAAEYRQEMDMGARRMELTTRLGGKLGGFIADQLDKQQRYNTELGYTLEAEKALAVEREREAEKTSTRGGRGARGGRGDNAAEKAANEIKSNFESLRQTLMTEIESADAWLAEAQNTLQEARQAGLIASETEYLETRLRINEEYNDRINAINGYNSDHALGSAEKFFGDMQEVAQAGGDKLTKIASIAGAAQALISAYIGASKELEKGTFGFASAAMVLARGFAFVSAIKSAGKGSKSNASAASSASAPAQSAPQRTINLTVQGEYFTGDTIQRMVEGINDFVNDGGNINVSRV